MSHYENLFRPLRVGGTVLRNRIIAAPISKYGLMPSPADELETIAAKARGGAGLVILGSVAVEDKESLIYYEASSLDGPKLPLYNEQLSVIHQYGAKASVQLLHCGIWADCRGTGANPVGPYSFTRTPDHFKGIEGIEGNQIMDGRTVVGIDEAKMDQICDDYARQAVKAKRMGFDMVMLHFAHGWLPAQFLSPFFNKRTDGYGGSFENRIRFPTMIVERVRQAVGPDYPLDMRIGAKEYVPGGLEVEDVVRFVQHIEDKIDMVHVSSGLDKFLGPTTYIESPSLHPHLINLGFAERMKQAVGIPVVTVGGITLPDEAEGILAAGKADAIAMARAFVADPEWANKARAGRASDITPCLRCCSCYGVATGNISQGCAVNPRYGRALRLKTELAAAPAQKHVVVVGGGPAGMKAAITSAENGHRVTLLEKESRLGGLLNISDGDAVKRDMFNYKSHLEHRTLHAGIDVRLGCEATPALVSELRPDELVVAVGSVPLKPRIPGIESPHTMDVLQAHAAVETLGGTVAVIGGGPSGCELALSLLDTGRSVVLVEQADTLATAAGNLLYQGAVEEIFAQKEKLTCLTGTACTAIVPEGLLVQDGAGERLMEADNVVYTVGMRPLRDEAMAFYDIVYDVKLVGDCLAPRRINEATHEGFFAGYRLGRV